jgi:hypothetical protein
MSVEFPLCRQPHHEAAIRSALAECVAVVTERLAAPGLVAIVLTGSFARGEGTVLPVADTLRVLGDFEFFVVLSGRPEAGLRRQMTAWGREASARLATLGVRVDVEFGPVGLSFLRSRARPSIFVHDLRHHGKVLWGRPDVLHLVPWFEAGAIPRDDAVRLIFNRIIEQLATWERLEGLDGDELLDAAYQRLKLTLDVAGSALAFAGMHTSIYRERPAAFARLLAETPSLETTLDVEFTDELERAARAKLDPAAALDTLGPAGVAGEQRLWLRRRMLSAVPVTTAVLRWELQALLQTRAPLPELLTRYARRASLGRRVWDWAKLFLNPLPAPLPISHLRAARLFWWSTPRGLVYAAGGRAYQELGRRASTGEELTHLLPLATHARPRDASAQRRAIVALWQWNLRNR